MIRRALLIIALLAMATAAFSQVKKISTPRISLEGIAADRLLQAVYLNADNAETGEDIERPDEHVVFGMAADARSGSILPAHGEGEYLAVNDLTHLVYHSSQQPTFELTVLDPSKGANAIVATVPFGGSEPYGIAIDLFRNIIYVGAKPPMPPGCVEVEADEGGEAGERARGADSNEPGDNEIIECERPGEIRVFDGNTTPPTLIKAIPAGDDPESIVFNLAADKLYAANEDDGTVTIASAVKREWSGFSGGDVLRTVKVFSNSVCAGITDPDDEAEEADKMAVDIFHNAVYVTDDKYRVAKIDSATDTVVGALGIGVQGVDFRCEMDEGANTANNIAVNYDLSGNSYIYVISEQNTITMIDPVKFEILATLTIPGAVHLDDVTALPLTGTIYVVDENPPALFIIGGTCAKGIASACTLVD